MDLRELYPIQRALDERITKEHNISADTTDLKIAAFKVELGELANEMRFFKFWSKKPMSDRLIILEEWTDGLHFLLSIAISRKWDRFIHVVESGYHKDLFYIELFNDLWEANFHSSGQFTRMFAKYLAIGEKLGFTEIEMIAGYKKKNEKNHARQESGVY